MTLVAGASRDRGGRCTALELAEAQLAAHRRHRRRDRRLGDARSRARASEQAQRCRRGRPCAGPLGGIGIGVKDIIATDDLPTTVGSPIYADHGPPEDATCVARLRAAGRVRVRQDGDDAVRVHGPGASTRNPWNARAHARRLVVGLGGGGRGRPRARGASARRPTARSSVPPPIAASSASSRRSARSRSTACILFSADVRHGRHVRAHRRRCGAASRARSPIADASRPTSRCRRTAALRLAARVSRGSSPITTTHARRSTQALDALRDAGRDRADRLPGGVAGRQGACIARSC